jgi:hypothetical protein
MFSATYRHSIRQFHSISFQNYGAEDSLRLKSAWLERWKSALDSAPIFNKQEAAIRGRSMLGKVLAPSMPDVQHGDGISLNGEQHTVAIPPTAIQHLSHVERKNIFLRGQGATLGRMRQAGYGVAQALKPSQSGFSGPLR